MTASWSIDNWLIVNHRYSFTGIATKSEGEGNTTDHDESDCFLVEQRLMHENHSRRHWTMTPQRTQQQQFGTGWRAEIWSFPCNKLPREGTVWGYPNLTTCQAWCLPVIPHGTHGQKVVVLISSDPEVGWQSLLIIDSHHKLPCFSSLLMKSLRAAWPLSSYGNYNHCQSFLTLIKVITFRQISQSLINMGRCSHA